MLGILLWNESNEGWIAHLGNTMFSRNSVKVLRMSSLSTFQMPFINLKLYPLGPRSTSPLQSQITSFTSCSSSALMNIPLSSSEIFLKYTPDNFNTSELFCKNLLVKYFLLHHTQFLHPSIFHQRFTHFK